MVCLPFFLQYPTRVRTCAATCVSSDPVDTPAPARKDPPRWSLTPMNATQVNSRLSAPAAAFVCFAPSRFTFMTPLFTRAWLLLCGHVTSVMLLLFADSVYAWLLLLQPLRQLSQCPLHVDA